MANPHTPRIMPPVAEPSAPIMPMKRSASPCVDARSAGDSASVSRALAATKARFQPMPLRNRPPITRTPLLPDAKPASITAPMSTTAPAAMLDTRPKRSLSQPESGEVTYMPPR